MNNQKFYAACHDFSFNVYDSNNFKRIAKIEDIHNGWINSKIICIS
jgi:hypothetical protein